MSKQTRLELLALLKSEYSTASGKHKTALIDQLIETTGYSRKHAIALLNKKRREGTRKQRMRTSLNQEAVKALTLIWNVANRICGKRLVPFIPDICQNLESHGHLRLTSEAKQQLFRVSAATVDRVLKPERQKCGRSLSHTKRAALVKNKVPVRTFADWNDVVPGFFEIDTVSHSSSNPNGPFLDTLNMTDIATCWTVPIALRAKTAVEVIRALEESKQYVPFSILGLDFDNGTEFLNEALIAWAEERKITYTRSRSYKKNDQAWIEEKNGSVVRRNVGRERYSDAAAYVALTELYATLALYFNFFQPCQKVLVKKREGSKLYRKYDVAKTPFQRVLENPQISDDIKKTLQEQRHQLDMMLLFESLEKQKFQLRQCAEDAPDPVLLIATMQRNATNEFVQRNQTRAKPEESLKNTLGDQVKAILLEMPTGTLVRARDLAHLGDSLRITQQLHRFVGRGLLQTTSWGVFQKLDHHEPEQTPLKTKVENKFLSLEPGTPVTWRDLQELSQELRLNSCLAALAKQGKIKRVQRGIYMRTTAGTPN
ncbi:MAG: hypothetical protein JOZ31_08920 [Verrucomicrobia bacterium]|nr:hypothetical protein [Verrucomicrobiota bacterium]